MRLSLGCVALHRLAVCIVAAFVAFLTPLVFAQDGSAALESWASETIELPPGFAPGMPSGLEELRFSPGWRDPDSDNFWSYAIVMRIEEPEPTRERLEELIDVYYSGLMSAFGVGRKPGSTPNEVNVDLENIAANRYLGTMQLVDGFATFEQTTVHLLIESRGISGSSCVLEVRLSRQPVGHDVWHELQVAIDSINAGQRDQTLKRLAQLPQGEWRTDIANGSQQRDVWSWGPGKHALTSRTTNSKGTGQSTFGSFRVVYQHPQRDELTVLALDAPELIQTGVLTPVDDLDLRFDMTLFYDTKRISWATVPTRTISSVWSFDTPTRYTNSWIEDQGRAVEPGLVSWAYTKHGDVTPPPVSAAAPPEHIRHLSEFIPLLKSVWEDGATRQVWSWIPYNEAILVRTVDSRTEKLITETVIYPHPHTKAIHTLTVHSSGVIDEGVARFERDAILISAQRAEQAGSSWIETRTQQPNADSIRTQIWSVQESERTLISDTTLRSATD
jgi:hypothetical protein